MEYIYWAYVNIFQCARRVKKLFVDEESKPIRASEGTWLSIHAETIRGTTIDVTREVKFVFPKDAFLTPDILGKGLSMYGVRDWYYLTKTLEYHKIQEEGIVNGL